MLLMYTPAQECPDVLLCVGTPAQERLDVLLCVGTPAQERHDVVVALGDAGARYVAHNVIHCRPHILQLHGMSLADFKTHSDALKTADALVKQNKEELGHAGTIIENELP